MTTELRLLRQGHPTDSRVCYDEASERWLTRAELITRAETFAADLGFHRKAFGFAFLHNDLPSLTAYLGTMDAGHAITALSPDLDPAFRTHLVDRFQPDFIVAPPPGEHQTNPADTWSPGPAYSPPALTACGMILWKVLSPLPRTIHPDLTLLISTSGSTGSPRLVRLSARNVLANAQQINAVVGATAADIAILTSPIFNPLGQSLVHGALASGGSFVLTRARIISAEFWDLARRCGCTMIAGTPYFYQVLDRLDLPSLNVPDLRIFVTSGGRLPEELGRKIHSVLAPRGGLLHIMYGQSEATARMSGVPPALLPDAARSVGFALPPGRFSVEADGVPCGPGVEGEIIYEGPGVMMGYAITSDDLASGDLLGGRVATGDLGHYDERGLFYITGRKSRFVKLFGWRISLDDVEEILSEGGHEVAVTNDGETIAVFHLDSDTDIDERVDLTGARLRLHPSCFVLHSIGHIPRLFSGKTNYQALRSRLGS